MKNKLFAMAALSVMLLNPGVFSFADTRPATAKRAQVGQLVNLLPASDGVVTLDAKRFSATPCPGFSPPNRRCSAISPKRSTRCRPKPAST